MWSACWPKRVGEEEAATPMLQMHTVVSPPLTAGARDGHISCRPIGREPIRFVWSAPDGGAVRTDVTGSQALDVGVGRYRVTAVDAAGARADVDVLVEPAHAASGDGRAAVAVVRGYRVTPASSAVARDGAVEAWGDHLEGRRWLWSNGLRTDGPRVRDVPCGTYACVPCDDGGPGVRLVHECAPARVSAVREEERPHALLASAALAEHARRGGKRGR